MKKKKKTLEFLRIPSAIKEIQGLNLILTVKAIVF